MLAFERKFDFQENFPRVSECVGGAVVMPSVPDNHYEENGFYLKPNFYYVVEEEGILSRTKGTKGIVCLLPCSTRTRSSLTQKYLRYMWVFDFNAH